jgi:hypothetical protein
LYVSDNDNAGPRPGIDNESNVCQKFPVDASTGQDVKLIMLDNAQLKHGSDGLFPPNSSPAAGHAGPPTVLVVNVR